MRLIDADAFFEKFRAGGDLYSELLESEDLREILKDEEITPTVDAEPVTHAHWNKEDIGSSTLYHCSECKAVCWGGGKYCHNCGARMDGDTDD